MRLPTARSITAFVSGSLLVSTCAWTQATASAAQGASAQAPVRSSSQAADSRAQDDALGINDIIVTAHGGGELKKIEASYAITTLSEKELRARSPRSIAEALEAVPGFQAQSSSGEAITNIIVRGMPLSGLASIQIDEDGLPVQQDPLFGRRADLSFKYDETIDRLEVVRGGASNIFASDAPGGVLNYISRRPGNDLSGFVNLTVSDYDTRRIDAWAGVPITDKLSLSVGGFYRTDKGGRDTGFHGNKGGQIKANLWYKDDTTDVMLGYKHIDDAVTFFTGIPLSRNAQTGKIGNIPGFSAARDTLIGPDGALLTYPIPGGGSGSMNLEEAYPTKLDQITLVLNKDLGDGWSISEKARYHRQTNDENSFFTGGFSSATDYLATASARAAANPYFASLGVVGANFEYVNYPNAPFSLTNQNGNGLVVTATRAADRSKRQEFVNDLSLTKKFNLLGEHSITAGYYYASQDFTQIFLGDNILLDVRPNARILDLIAVNAAGNPVIDPSGRSLKLTERGVLQFNPFAGNGTDNQVTNAFYLADEWNVTPWWRVDLGLRYEKNRYHATSPQYSCGQNLGDPTTLADDNYCWLRPGANGATNTFFDPRHGTAWSIGTNYKLRDNLAVFARYTKAFRFDWSNMSEPLREMTDSTSLATNQTSQLRLWEGGLLYNSRKFSVSATVFRNVFKDRVFAATVLGSTGLIQAVGNVVTYGGEAEVFWGPFNFLDFRFNGSLQNNRDSNVSDAKDIFGNVIFAGSLFEGKRTPQTPEILFTFTPGVNFLNRRGRVQLEFRHVGKTYADFSNNSPLPAFSALNASASFALNNHLSFAVVARNLTNTIGVESGDPNQPFVGNSSQTYFSGVPIVGRSVRVSLRFEL